MEKEDERQREGIRKPRSCVYNHTGSSQTLHNLIQTSCREGLGARACLSASPGRKFFTDKIGITFFLFPKVFYYCCYFLTQLAYYRTTTCYRSGTALGLGSLVLTTAFILGVPGIELRLSFSPSVGKAVQFTTFPDTHWVWGGCGHFRNTLPRTCHLRAYQGKHSWRRESRQTPRRGHWRAGRRSSKASQTPGEIWPQNLHQYFLYKYTRSRQEARLRKVKGAGPPAAHRWTGKAGRRSVEEKECGGRRGVNKGRTGPFRQGPLCVSSWEQCGVAGQRN